jgi:hypothetical protein
MYARDYLAHPGTTSIEEETDLAPLDLAVEREAFDRVVSLAPTAAEAANRTRLELLARQYVAKQLSPEEEARLEIVAQRVRRLIPRVTAADLESLETIAQESSAIHRRNEDRRRRLGM